MVSSSVKNYVNQKDIEATRTALTTIGYIADYDSFKNFEASTEFARNQLEELFQTDDKQLYDTSETIDSYKKIIKLMMSNFSEEKYSSAIKIGSSVFANESDDYIDASEENREEAPESDSFFTKLIQSPMRIVIAVMIIIAIIAVVINLLK